MSLPMVFQGGDQFAKGFQEDDHLAHIFQGHQSLSTHGFLRWIRSSTVCLWFSKEIISKLPMVFKDQSLP